MGNDIFIKSLLLDSLMGSLESSIYDTDDDQLNNYVAGATIAIKNVYDKFEEYHWLKNMEDDHG